MKRFGQDFASERLARFRGTFVLLSLFLLLILMACRESASPTGSVSSHRSAESDVVALKAPEVAAGHNLEEPPANSTRYPLPELGEGNLLVKASWEQATGAGMTALRESETVGEAITNLSIKQPERSYQFKELAGLLPGRPVAIGEVWRVSDEATADLLSQFHPNVLTLLNMDGIGSYGVLRAASEEFLEFQYRLHAQFEVVEGVYYTPAYFGGSLLLERSQGRIVTLNLKVPTEKALNLGYEMHVGEFLVGLGFIPRMELVAGAHLESGPVWQEEISAARALDILSDRFYEFAKIDWLPPAEVTAASKKLKRPIFAVVIEGVLDDQSC